MARPVSTKYRRRVAAVRPVTTWLREKAQEDLENGLREATQEQLYDRTPLKVTRALYNSVGSRVLGQVVEVGYNIGSATRAAYAAIRVNMKGTSKTGGHQLDMQPNTYLRRKVDPKIRRRSKNGQKMIIGD